MNAMMPFSQGTSQKIGLVKDLSCVPGGQTGKLTHKNTANHVINAKKLTSKLESGLAYCKK
jgi:hypothetical protein